MAFKKTCFVCGEKVDNLINSRCENCFKEEFPAVKEIKPVIFKIDNMSRKIWYNNHYYPEDKILEMLPDIMKKRVILNENYKLNKVEIENFEVVAHKLKFDLVVDSDFKNE